MSRFMVTEKAKEGVKEDGYLISYHLNITLRGASMSNR